MILFGFLVREFCVCVLIIFDMTHYKRKYGQLMLVVLISITCIVFLALGQPHNCSVSQGEVDALQSIYNSTSGANWDWRPEYNTTFNGIPITNDTVWTFPAKKFEPCLYLWQGVECALTDVQNQICAITSLSLSFYSLSGSIPSEVFSGLSALNYIDLDNNLITGKIASSLYELVNLTQLYLDHNLLTGTLSPNIGNLTQLTLLDVQNNLLEGPLPISMSKLTLLTHLSVYVNSFSHSIPTQLSTLTKMDKLSLDSCHFTGSIPSQFSALKGSITRFYVYSNFLTNTLPPQLSTLTNLQLMYFNLNHLTGTMPKEYSTLSKLQVMYFFGNLMTGTIPPDYSTLVGLKTFLVKLNLLSGSIPNQFSTMTNLIGLGVGTNMLTGTVPSTFGNFGALDYFKMYDNSFHGTLPDSYSKLSTMSYFNFAANHMSGTLPSSYSNLSKLKQMFLFSNVITGTLPSEYSYLPKIQFVYLGNNKLQGTIPSSYSNLKMLENFDISENRFKGSFYYPDFNWPILTFLNISYNEFSGSIRINSSNYPSMQFLDMSRNNFRGKIPPSLFQDMKHLKMLSLSNNCLDADLPDAICNLQELETLLLDKLGSECNDTTYKFFSSTKHMPSCFWEIPSLATLHSIGNGLLGHLGEAGPNLTDVAIMSNLFTGSIPRSFQVNEHINQLILSFNRFSGTLESDFYLPKINAINLTSNRLSGDLPSFLLDLKGQDRIDVIGGNLFMCVDAPTNDVHHGTYECGSKALTISAYTYSIMIGVGFLLIVIFLSENLWRKKHTPPPLSSLSRGDSGIRNSGIGGRNDVDGGVTVTARIQSVRLSPDDSGYESKVEEEQQPSCLWDFFCLCDPSTNSKLSILRQYWQLYPQLSLFQSCIISWSTMIWHLLLACILISINTIAKGDGNVTYGTLVYQYGWVSGFGYTHGWGPVILICVVVYISIMIFFSKSISWGIIKWKSKGAIKTVDVSGGNNYKLIVFQCINIVVVCVANFFYISILAKSTDSGVRNALPFILGFFKAIWGLGFIDFMMKNSGVSSAYIYINELFATLFVFFISPLLLIALTEFNCYYYAWHSLPSVEVSYPSTITDCNTICIGGSCQVLCPTTFITETTSVEPPWIYGYQCGSSIIVSYTPVVLNSYLISGLMVPITQIAFIMLTTRKFRRDLLLNPKLRMFPLETLCCLTFSRLDLDSPDSNLLTVENSEYYAKMKDIRTSRYLSTTARDVVMIITFGISSPFIIFVVLFTLLISDVVRRLQLGSFKYDLMKVNKEKDFEYFCNTSIYRGDLEELYKSQTLVMVLIIMGFWAILCYDMIADIYGNANGLIAMFTVGFGMVIITVASSYYYSTNSKIDDSINSFFSAFFGEIEKKKASIRLRVTSIFRPSASSRSNDTGNVRSSNNIGSRPSDLFAPHASVSDRAIAISDGPPKASVIGIQLGDASIADGPRKSSGGYEIEMRPSDSFSTTSLLGRGDNDDNL